MSNNDKICFWCGAVCPHKVKCPSKPKVCNKCKKIGHYAKCFKTKLRQKGDNHKDNSRHNPHSGQALFMITHSPSRFQEYENRFDDEVYSENYEYLFAVQGLFKDQVFETW